MANPFDYFNDPFDEARRDQRQRIPLSSRHFDEHAVRGVMTTELAVGRNKDNPEVALITLKHPVVDYSLVWGTDSPGLRQLAADLLNLADRIDGV